MAKASSGSLRADSLVFIPGAWSAEEIGVRKRLGNCAEQLAGADALPEAALRAVVREVRAELVALGLPRDDNTATREICGGLMLRTSRRLRRVGMHADTLGRRLTPTKEIFF